ncbi:glutamine synthetase family protein [Plasticicumulans acidivorans]|uniref:Glutamate--putrescine ligase n=1 Tax=Plasticicumulans acidivorans TaxID=886464 RepID=A0A317MQP8_9GAMM|nr:glutamine synthetase family protein [Plasticicumulans acidivorans]PWV58731.1 glutamate--putrescine ligase [Plasticicumulans acidivorans]
MNANATPATAREEVEQFLQLHPDIEVFEMLIPDTNGVLRGKWIPRSAVTRFAEHGMRMPASVFALDIWGNDVLESGIVLETGDRDSVCMPVPGSLTLVPWLRRPTAQMLMTMREPDGAPFFGDPRYVLASVLARFAEMGLTPVVALELEFYLLDREAAADGSPQPPISPSNSRRQWTSQVYGIDELHEFEDFFDAVSRACALQNLPVDTTVAEQAPSQFEINLKHQPDAILAADNAVLLKRVIKGAAQQYQMAATFMAKPYGELAGNGMHIHFSLLDQQGRNVFDDGSHQGSPLLRHAIAGMVTTMRETMCFYAPNTNSFRRFQPGSHAPIAATWGYDNRSTALRIPSGDTNAMRVEHRVAGADANPYLALAAMLGGAWHGIVNRLDPGEPTSGNAHECEHVPMLPTALKHALEIFDRSVWLPQVFGESYHQLYSACRWQELEKFGRQVTPLEYESYLRTV